ncbi:MAG: insulinase family protein [Planctomycetota bacterium]|nr:insulinase family protein [Planctomycetota bacterium]
MGNLIYLRYREPVTPTFLGFFSEITRAMFDTPRLPEMRFQKTTLANGLDVIVRRDHKLPVVAVNLWYRVGSKNEERRLRGFAHLFEHLMFEGSQHFPGDFFKPLQKLGASINGSTSSDRTNYFVDVPTAHLELVLAMESDRMGFLLPALDDAKLRIQKDVVKNEYRQNYANRPYGMVGALLSEALYPPNHPYNWLTIGRMEDVEAASRDDVEAFFKRYYVPANASLSLVGDLDEDHALALADRWFGSIPGGVRALRPWAPDVDLTHDIDINLRDRVELERVYSVWPTVPRFHRDDAALALLSDVLTYGRAARLYRKLVQEKELAQDVGLDQTGRELAGSFSAVVTLRPGRDPEEARAAVEDELRAVASKGVEQHELDRVRNARLAGLFTALESIGGFGGVADRLNMYNVYVNDPARLTTDFERYQAVTPDHVRDVARLYLADRPRVTLTAVPASRTAAATRTTDAAPLDRTRPPASTPAASFKAALPEVRKLKCGIPLWVVPRCGLPIVTLTFVWSGGAGRHPSSSGGLAHLTASMLDEGTTTRDSVQIALEIERLGSRLSTHAGWDSASVSLHSLTTHLEAGLDLVFDVALRPSWPEGEWKRIHGQAMAALRSERAGAESRAGRALLAALYPGEHPYGVPVNGDEGSVGRITIDDLSHFQQRSLVPSTAAVIAAGDIDPDRLAALLDERLAGWGNDGGPGADLAAIDRPVSSGSSRILLLDRPRAPQAVLRAGHVGMTQHDPDVDDARVMNQILGGQFTSRLNEKLREEKGYTYGARSGFDLRGGAGPFTVSASLQSDKLADALADVRHELESFLSDRPPTEREVDDARRALIEGFPRHFETASDLVVRHASLFIHNLPIDHHARHTERLNAVTTASAAAAASRRLRPDELVYVVVADADEVRAPLEALGWGPVTVLPDPTESNPA